MIQLKLKISKKNTQNREPWRSKNLIKIPTTKTHSTKNIRIVSCMHT